jgi:hypothetical protein
VSGYSELIVEAMRAAMWYYVVCGLLLFVVLELVPPVYRVLARRPRGPRRP